MTVEAELVSRLTNIGYSNVTVTKNFVVGSLLTGELRSWHVFVRPQVEDNFAGFTYKLSDDEIKLVAIVQRILAEGDR